MKKLTNPHLCSWIFYNAVNQCGVGSSRLLVSPLRGLQLDLIDFGLDQGFQKLILVVMFTTDVDDLDLVVLHGDPHLALGVPALVEG